MVEISRVEAADTIDRFLEGLGEPYEWDDFVSIRCSDPTVEEARLQCIAVRDDHPPQQSDEYCSETGRKALRAIAARLRANAA